jgi:PAS domain S-box-containing protein
VVEQSAENIFLIDVVTRRIIETNPAFQKLLGYSAEEMLHLTGYDIIAHPRPDIDNKIDRIKAKKRVFLGERKYRRKNGSLVDVEASVSLVEFGGRSVMCVVSRDITERKAAEQRLRAAYDDLEERVKERTGQLADLNRQLRFEQEMLERKNAALKELLSHIEDGKQQLAVQIKTNIKKVALPILDQIEGKIGREDRRYFELLKRSLEDIASPFLSNLENRFAQLTPRELEICNLIRNGFNSQQIATSLSKSVQTVLKQRKMIRKKLGINAKKINLATYLKRMT